MLVLVISAVLALPACVSQEPASGAIYPLDYTPPVPVVSNLIYPPDYTPPVREVFTITHPPPTPYPSPPDLPPLRVPLTPLPDKFVGPGCFVDNYMEYFSLFVAHDWILYPAHTGGITYMYNYPPEELHWDHGFAELPPGWMKIEIYSMTLLPGQSLEEQMKVWFSQDEIGQYQPYTLGKYSGLIRIIPPIPSEGYGGASNIIFSDIIFSKWETVLSINLWPIDSPTFEEALEMLATLEIGGETCSSWVWP